MKERLVERIDTFCKKELGTNFNKDILDKFADYILADGWIRPPCKVGDKLYFLYNNNVFDLEVEKIVQKETGLFLVDKQCNDWYSVDEIGKTLYLTREEAEAKLKEGADNEHK